MKRLNLDIDSPFSGDIVSLAFAKGEFQPLLNQQKTPALNGSFVKL